jgi:transcriptional regulator
MSKPKMEMVKGTLDILILKSLSWGSMHGYGVMRWIRETTDDALQVEEGALYPALHRMEERGWLRAEWGVSENNRRAKFYTLTSAGRDQLQIGSSRWTTFAESVAKILSATERPVWAVQT